MQSLKTLAIMKTAVAISFYPELKREILCARASEFDVTKSRYIYCRKEQWNAIIEKKVRAIFRCQGLPKVLADAVLNLLPAIGLKMLIWAEYHEGTLGLTRDYSVNFLSYSHLTREGVVDNVKAAKDLLEYGNLDVKQKYKLACLYCFVDNIGPLYKEIVKDHGKDAIFSASNTKWFQKPGIVEFWTRQKTHKIGKSYEHSRFFRTRRLQQAIKSGSKAAVIYSWNAKGFSSHKRILLAAVEEILISGSTRDDWIIFKDSRYNDVEDSWVPTDYSDDIFRFIFLKMLELQQQGCLQIDVLDFLDRQKVSVMYHHSSFELFLCWPHQEYFMKTATGMWEFISMETYAALLLNICDRIEPPKYKNLQYGEEKCCDYKYILKEFWRESPDRYKRYVFQSTCWFLERSVEKCSAAKGVLLKLLSLKNFTCEDEEIVRSILDSATDREREYLLSATCWKNTFLTLMQDERFKTFDRFLRVCFRSELEADMFKQNLKLDVEEAEDICKIFLKYKKLDAIKSFLNRIPINGSQLECLKYDLIYSPEGKLKCLEILSDDGTKAFEKFLRWFLPTKESAKAFKRALTLEHSCDSPHSDESQCHDEFGLEMCEELICSHSLEVVSSVGYSSLYVKSNFRGGQWKKLDQLLLPLRTNKILAFKEMVYRLAGVRILCKLIEAKQWTQTENFFKWLKLSKQEITELKWEALTTPEGTGELLHYLVFSENDDEANKLERIYAMLKWHLTNSNEVLEFQRFFLNLYQKFGEADLHIFTSVVDMYLDELDKKRFEKLNARVRKADRAEIRQNKDICVGGVRRQSPGPATPKKARLSQPGEKKKAVIGKRRQSQRLLDQANKK